MANFKCVAPGHEFTPVLYAETLPGLTVEWAVNPEDSEYQEVHLCRKCATDARDAGVRTVEISEARKIIRRHKITMERAEFFRSFVRTQPEETQAMSA